MRHQPIPMTSERANKSIRCHLIAAMLSEKPASRNTAGALKSERAVPAAGAASLLGVSEGFFGGFGVLLAPCCPLVFPLGLPLPLLHPSEQR